VLLSAAMLIAQSITACHPAKHRRYAPIMERLAPIVAVSLILF